MRLNNNSNTNSNTKLFHSSSVPLLHHKNQLTATTPAPAAVDHSLINLLSPTRPRIAIKQKQKSTSNRPISANNNSNKNRLPLYIVNQNAHQYQFNQLNRVNSIQNNPLLGQQVQPKSRSIDSNHLLTTSNNNTNDNNHSLWSTIAEESESESESKAIHNDNNTTTNSNTTVLTESAAITAELLKFQSSIDLYHNRERLSELALSPLMNYINNDYKNLLIHSLATGEYYIPDKNIRESVRIELKLNGNNTNNSTESILLPYPSMLPTVDRTISSNAVLTVKETAIADQLSADQRDTVRQQLLAHLGPIGINTHSSTSNNNNSIYHSHSPSPKPSISSKLKSPYRPLI